MNGKTSIVHGQKGEKMYRKLLWIGLGILTSWQIVLHSVEVVQRWISNTDQCVESVGERKEDA